MAVLVNFGGEGYDNLGEVCVTPCDTISAPL